MSNDCVSKLAPMSSSQCPSPRLRSRTAQLTAVGMLLGLLATVFTVAGPASAATPTPTPTIYLQNNGSADPLPSRRFMVRTWLIADADTGQVLAAQNPNQQMPPASTIKLLTLYSMLPRLQADSTYTATKQDVAMVGSRVGLAAGSSYSVEDLYRGMFLPSGNDAASALANAYGGWDRTLRVMNAEAKRLHANDTRVTNPSGLDEPDQYSSAFDLATIMRAALREPEFLRIASLRQSSFPGPEPKAGGNRGSYQIWSENRLLLNGYPGTLAGKTGFTSKAGRTFVAAVKRNGKTLIVALMRSAFSTERTAEALFEWGFANHDKVTPVGQLPEPDPVVNAPIARPAQVLDAEGVPVPGRNPRIPDEEVGLREVSSSGVSPVVFLALMLLLMAAAVVALRVRVLIRIRRRRGLAVPVIDSSRELIAEASRLIQSASARVRAIRSPRPTAVDLRDPTDQPGMPARQTEGSGTNPTRW